MVGTISGRSPLGCATTGPPWRMAVNAEERSLAAPGARPEWAPTALLVRGLEPVPALLHVGVTCLRGIRDEEGVLLGVFVHAGARSEVVRALGAPVQHDDQRDGLPGVAARNVQFIGAGPSAVGVRALDE